MSKDLLLEIGTEEIPASFLPSVLCKRCNKCYRTHILHRKGKEPCKGVCKGLS
jgi:glycyl-tRNA synthetase beta subunit